MRYSTTMNDKPNTGALFQNDKRPTEKHPHYRGSINTETGKYSLSCWETTARDAFALNKGAMFENPDKQTEKHPDYIGVMNVNQTMYYLSAWNRESAQGRKYFSIALRVWRNEFTALPANHYSLSCQDWIDKK